jgi:hypothetical protein
MGGACVSRHTGEDTQKGPGASNRRAAHRQLRTSLSGTDDFERGRGRMRHERVGRFISDGRVRETQRAERGRGEGRGERGKAVGRIVSTLPHAGVDSNDFWREGDLKVCWDPLGGGTAVLRRSP